MDIRLAKREIGIQRPDAMLPAIGVISDAFTANLLARLKNGVANAGMFSLEYLLDEPAAEPSIAPEYAIHLDFHWTLKEAGTDTYITRERVERVLERLVTERVKTLETQGPQPYTRARFPESADAPANVIRKTPPAAQTPLNVFRVSNSNTLRAYIRGALALYSINFVSKLSSPGAGAGFTRQADGTLKVSPQPAAKVTMAKNTLNVPGRQTPLPLQIMRFGVTRGDSSPIKAERDSQKLYITPDNAGEFPRPAASGLNQKTDYVFSSKLIHMDTGVERGRPRPEGFESLFRRVSRYLNLIVRKSAARGNRPVPAEAGSSHIKPAPEANAIKSGHAREQTPKITFEHPTGFALNTRAAGIPERAREQRPLPIAVKMPRQEQINTPAPLEYPKSLAEYTQNPAPRADNEIPGGQGTEQALTAPAIAARGRRQTEASTPVALEHPIIPKIAENISGLDTAVDTKPSVKPIKTARERKLPTAAVKIPQHERINTPTPQEYTGQPEHAGQTEKYSLNSVQRVHDKLPDRYETEQALTAPGLTAARQRQIKIDTPVTLEHPIIPKNVESIPDLGKAVDTKPLVRSIKTARERKLPITAIKMSQRDKLNIPTPLEHSGQTVEYPQNSISRVHSEIPDGHGTKQGLIAPGIAVTGRQQMKTNMPVTLEHPFISKANDFIQGLGAATDTKNFFKPNIYARERRLLTAAVKMPQFKETNTPVPLEYPEPPAEYSPDSVSRVHGKMPDRYGKEQGLTAHGIMARGRRQAKASAPATPEHPLISKIYEFIPGLGIVKAVNGVKHFTRPTRTARERRLSPANAAITQREQIDSPLEHPFIMKTDSKTSLMPLPPTGAAVTQREQIHSPLEYPFITKTDSTTSSMPLPPTGAAVTQREQAYSPLEHPFIVKTDSTTDSMPLPPANTALAQREQTHTPLEHPLIMKTNSMPIHRRKTTSTKRPVTPGSHGSQQIDGIANRLFRGVKRKGVMQTPTLMPGELEYVLPGQPDAAGHAPVLPPEAPASKEMPAWAKDFFDGKLPRAQTAERQKMRRAGLPSQRPAAQAMQSAQQNARQTVWAAPGYAPPAKLAHKEKEEQKPQQNARFSEAEVSRLANRVYSVLEERISREMRRMGL